MENTAEKQDLEVLSLAAKSLQQAMGASGRANGSSRFELYLERRSTLKIDARNQKIDTFSRSEDAGLSVRVLKNRKMGFSFTTSLSEEAINRAARSAWEIADYMPEDPHHELPSLSQSLGLDSDSLQILDREGPQHSTEAKIKMALELEELCRNQDPRIQAVRSATLSETVFSQKLMDTDGNLLESRSSIYGASLTCKAEQNGDHRMGGDALHSPFLKNILLTQVAENAVRNATELLGAKNAPTLRCPAILRNDVMADLIDFIAASFSAEQVDKGRSMLNLGHQGQMICSPCVTLIDDGLLPRGVGSSPFDGEGTPSGTTALVKEGRLKRFLCDRYHAKKLGLDPTGNAGRGIKNPPSITTSNLYLKPGPQSAASLLEGIQTGVLITDLMGVHTANPVTGDFSLGASGFMIHKGQISHAISGFAVAGNILEVFRTIEAIGNDLKFFGSTGAVSVRIPLLSIGGSSS